MTVTPLEFVASETEPKRSVCSTKRVPLPVVVVPPMACARCAMYDALLDARGAERIEVDTSRQLHLNEGSRVWCSKNHLTALRASS